ncbi:2'-5' RNA ligase family protein [Actinoplanes sp. TFC3]|uniref:2'-5' RNA ligase family protein n=1 Tax=Actinoplanes sp. TFC3 TaxID=1710355 RepID=UPI00082A35AB|nr:2'-5' RNA ligase family protein [Actinoplanes sp. TFC3]
MTPTHSALIIAIPEAEPAAPLIALTHAITAAYPQAQPYQGAHPEVIPHLTIGHDHPRHTLRQAETATTAHLPLHAIATHVHLIQGRTETGTTWHTTHSFALTAIAPSA